MQTKTIFRYEKDGRTAMSPIKPDGAKYATAMRLVADEGKMLTLDGVSLTTCVDVDSADGWYEVDAPPEERPEEPGQETDGKEPDGKATEADYQDALRELGVSING